MDTPEVLTKEAEYAATKELDLTLLPPQSGIILPANSFNRRRTAEGFGMKTIYSYMALAAREPDWLPIDTDLPEEGNPLLLPTDKLIEYCASLDESMLPFAREYRGFKQPFNVGPLAARAFELMSDDFPNISLFRGTNFDRPLNSDFTISMPGALSFVFTIGGTAGVRRTLPSFVRLPVKNLMQQYRDGGTKVTVGTGSSFAIGSVRISGDYAGMKYEIYRPPLNLKTPQEQDEWIVEMCNTIDKPDQQTRITEDMLHEAVQKRLNQYR